MEIRSVGAEMFQADGRTDKAKLIVAFRNFANAPKNERKWRSPHSCFSVLRHLCVRSGQCLPISSVSTSCYIDPSVNMHILHVLLRNPPPPPPAPSAFPRHAHYTSQQERHTDSFFMK